MIAQGQDEERDSLVESLQSQIIMMHSEWQNARSQRDAGKEVNCSNAAHNGRNEALQLRLSLVSKLKVYNIFGCRAYVALTSSNYRDYVAVAGWRHVRHGGE